MNMLCPPKIPYIRFVLPSDEDNIVETKRETLVVQYHLHTVMMKSPGARTNQPINPLKQSYIAKCFHFHQNDLETKHLSNAVTDNI